MLETCPHAHVRVAPTHDTRARKEDAVLGSSNSCHDKDSTVPPRAHCGTSHQPAPGIGFAVPTSHQHDLWVTGGWNPRVLGGASPVAC